MIVDNPHRVIKVFCFSIPIILCCYQIIVIISCGLFYHRLGLLQDYADAIDVLLFSDGFKEMCSSPLGTNAGAQKHTLEYFFQHDESVSFVGFIEGVAPLSWLFLGLYTSRRV